MNKGLSYAWDLLAQRAAEQDEQFREEIRKRAWQGLKVVGLAMLLIPLVMKVAAELLTAKVPASRAADLLAVSIAAVGAITLLSRRLSHVRAHPRLVGWLAAAVAADLLVWFSLLRAQTDPVFLALIDAQVAVVLLIVLMSVPFRPVQVLALGLTIELSYFISCQLGMQWGIIAASDFREMNLMFLTMLAGLSTAVSVNLYRQIRQTYLMHAEQIEAMDELRNTQCRVMLSDSAASMGRLAAALSHELNNPLGVLKSNLHTLRTTLSESKELPPEKRAAMAELRTGLCRDSMESVERLQGTVERMQRFTNLDRAEVLPVNLNTMLRDVADIVSSSNEQRAKFEFSLQPLLDVEVRPQLMSAVFSALFQNAVDAGPEGSPVQVSSRLENGAVTVRIRDAGPGVSPDKLESALDPNFQVAGDRVAACNWSMFSARQTVRQHGGEIGLESGPGEGNTIVVTLPVQPAGGLARDLANAKGADGPQTRPRL